MNVTPRGETEQPTQPGVSILPGMGFSQGFRAVVLGSLVGAMVPVAIAAQAEGGPSPAPAVVAAASTAPPLLSTAGPTFTVPENKLSKQGEEGMTGGAVTLFWASKD